MWARVSLAIPTAGLSALSVAGAPFHDPDADEALFGALRTGLRGDIELIAVPTHVNDPAFAVAMAERLDKLLREARPAPDASPRRASAASSEHRATQAGSMS